MHRNLTHRCAGLCIGLAVLPSFAAGDLIEALTAGQPEIYLRFRHEYVDDATSGLRDAHASTLRSALGYRTGLFHGFGLHGQLEDVRVIGPDSFNDGGGNGVKDRAVIADPGGPEIHQANVRFEGISRTVLRVGRQEIVHREQLHRFLSNVPWRQNWQSYDAFRILNQSLPHTTIDYAWIWNVNRIFGEDNPLPDRSDYRMDSHFMRIVHDGLPVATLEAYVYALDFESTASERFSTATYGGRFHGSREVWTKVNVQYAGEVAHQTDFAGNSNAIAVNYYLGELGVNYAAGGLLSSLGVKIGYEVLEGDGGFESFQTPLATPHPFHGWSDRFTLTPGDGLEDLFLTAVAMVRGAKIQLEFHDFSSNRDNYNYGGEWDLLLEKQLGQHFLLALKFAAYEGDDNSVNLLRNRASGEPFDLTKAWAYLQFTY